ncbi:MAG TPA: hydrogenase nickel incorporation protein HypB [Thermoflexia bacterium]|jgi:hydrogenase nickel incorporation protein HypB|nr:hydrogenase nickel incorporation protein HypB [Thermoflexia bacterium]
MTRRVSVVENILSANDRLAADNRARLDEARVFAINLMASPGAGKTSLITRTVEALRDRLRIGVVDGDLASTLDADRVAALGIPAVQVNTGGNCHLDAVMLQSALPQLPLEELDLLIVENVGNLVCPASFKLGVHKDVLIASVPEGDDKPYKYPPMYRGVDALVLNKIDVLGAFDFDVDYFRRGVEVLNPGLAFFPLSCKTGEGLSAWLDWVEGQVRSFKEQG